MTSEELEHKIAVLLGGHAAEKLVFGHLSTGAADDLSKATDIARGMVTRYGMDEKLGFVTYGEKKDSYLGTAMVPTLCDHELSERTLSDIDNAVRRIVSDAFDLGYHALKDNRAVLDRCAEALGGGDSVDERNSLIANSKPVRTRRRVAGDTRR